MVTRAVLIGGVVVMNCKKCNKVMYKCQDPYNRNGAYYCRLDSDGCGWVMD